MKGAYLTIYCDGEANGYEIELPDNYTPDDVTEALIKLWGEEEREHLESWVVKNVIKMEDGMIIERRNDRNMLAVEIIEEL